MFASKFFTTCLLGLTALTGMCQAAPAVEALERRQSDTIKVATTTLVNFRRNTDKHLSVLATLNKEGADLTPALNSLIKEVDNASSIIGKLKADNLSESKEAGEAWGAAFANTLIGIKGLKEITPEAQRSIDTLDKSWVTLQRYVWLYVERVYSWGKAYVYGFVKLEDYFGALNAAYEWFDSMHRRRLL